MPRQDGCIDGICHESAAGAAAAIAARAAAAAAAKRTGGFTLSRPTGYSTPLAWAS